MDQEEMLGRNPESENLMSCSTGSITSNFAARIKLKQQTRYSNTSNVL